MKWQFVLITLLIAAAFPINLCAQVEVEWAQTYSLCPVGYQMVLAEDGTLYVTTGCFNPDSTDLDIGITCIGANGDSLDSWRFGTDEPETVGGIHHCRDGGFLCYCNVNYSSGTGDSQIELFRININGDSLWSMRLEIRSSATVSGCFETEDGGFLLAGTFLQDGPQYDFFLVKISGEGLTQWNRTYGSELSETCSWFKPTADGGYLLGGNSGIDNDIDFILMKVDETGDSLWSMTYDYERQREFCYSALSLTDGCYLLTGLTQDDWNGTIETLIIKVDEDGDEIWRSLTHANRVCGMYASEALDSSIWVAGQVWELTEDEIWEEDLWMGRYSSGGQFLGEVIFPIEGFQRLRWFTQAEDGSFLLVGDSEMRLIVVKTTSDDQVVDDHEAVPDALILLPAFPNPFNSTLTIAFSVGARHAVPLRLAIYDLNGKMVADLIDGRGVLQYAPTSGEHKVTWDASSVGAGIYFVRLEAGEEVKTQKIVLMR